MTEEGTVLERAMKHASRGGVDERGFYGYLDLFDVTKDDVGSLMLDLGSGQEEYVAAEAKNEGITVVSFNPALAIEGHRKILKSVPKGHLKRSVAAVAQEPWPFPDNKFDSIFSYQAIPVYLNEDEYKTAFSEAVRTLKSGRKAWFSPINLLDDNDRKVYEDSLEGLPATYLFEPILGKLSGRPVTVKTPKGLYTAHTLVVTKN